MSDLTIKTWVAQEKNAFHNFREELAKLLEESMLRALAERLRIGLKDDNKAAVELPWGTYSAEFVQRGETGNVTPKWEPSEGFMNLLNGDLGRGDAGGVNQEVFDERYVELFTDWLTHGRFYEVGAKNKEKTEKRKGLVLGADEVSYFLNGYAYVLATIAKDKQRDGKIFSLEINSTFPHGRFDFEYDDDKIIPVFVPDKVFKQLLKDDAAAMAASESDFTVIGDGEVRKDILPVGIDADEAKAS